MKKSIILTQPEIEMIKFMLDEREDILKFHSQAYPVEFLFEEQDRIISIRKKLFDAEYAIPDQPID